LVDGVSRSADALHCEREIEQGFSLVAARVFDRQAGHTGGRRDLDVARNVRWHRRKAVLEVGVDGNVNRLDDRAQVSDGLVPRHAAVTLAKRPGETGARGRERWKPELFEHARAANVPGI